MTGVKAKKKTSAKKPTKKKTKKKSTPKTATRGQSGTKTDKPKPLVGYKILREKVYHTVTDIRNIEYNQHTSTNIYLATLSIPATAKRIIRRPKDTNVFKHKCRVDKYKIVKIEQITSTLGKSMGVPVLGPADADVALYFTFKNVGDKKIVHYTFHDNDPFEYQAGKTYKSMNFNADRKQDCGEGLHFFLKKSHALRYY